MEGWLKQNKATVIIASVIAISFIYLMFFSGPQNYEECFIEKMNEAKNTEVAKSIHVPVRDLCRQSFQANLPS